MKITVIAPHPDDEAIGCGGTLCLHAERGDQVGVVFLTSGEHGLKHLPRDDAWKIREAEAEAAASALGLSRVTFLRRPDWGLEDDLHGTVAALAPVLEGEEPEIVYLPHQAEWHPDHKVAEALVRRALHGYSHSPVLRAYEVWSPLGSYDHIEDITQVITRKLRAVRCYRSQIQHFKYDRAVRGLNQYRGELAARCRFAEVFQTVAPHEA